MTKIIFVIIFNLLVISMGFGSDLVGRIADRENGKLLGKAIVRLEGTNYGTLTDNAGIFKLSQIPPGNYYLFVSFIGYDVYKQKINIPYNDTLQIFLKPQSFRMEEVVVTATKRLQVVQEVPVSVSIISNDFLSDRAFIRFDEALRQTPGLIVNKDNINIRGSSGFSFGLGSRVAYLINGFQFLSGDNGDAKFDILPIEAIDKIEVVKGAGSALYGSSAIGGVVNVITKDFNKPFFIFSLQSGIYTKPKYDQWIYSDKFSTKTLLSVSYGDDFGLFQSFISGSFLNDESYRKYDKSQRCNFFAKLNRDFKNYGKFSIFGFYAYDHRDDWVYWNSLDSATLPPTFTDTERKLISIKLGTGLEWRFYFSRKTFGVFRSNLYHTNLDFEHQIFSSEYRQSSAFSLSNELQLNSHLPDNTLFSYGVNFQNNWINSYIYGKRKQSLFSSFAQVELTKLENWIFNLGGRLDIEKCDLSKTNFEFSPKIGVNYKLLKEKEIFLRFSVGRGFRSPTIAERFATIKFGGFNVVSNFDLRAERSWSSELGFTMESVGVFAPLILDFVLFYSRYSDLIEPQFDPNQVDPVIKFMNVTKAVIYGLEISTKSLLLNQLPITFAVAYLNPIDLRDGSILKYRSKFSINSSVSIPFNFVNFTADFRYLSKIERIDEILRVQVSDYDARVPIYVLDLYLTFDLKKFSIPLKAILSCQNALDYYYVEMVGNLAPTRHISLKLQFY